MSELINNRVWRVQTLKDKVTEVHKGTPAQEVKAKLKILFAKPTILRSWPWSRN